MKDEYNFLDQPSPPDVERFVDRNFAISERVHAIMGAKGISQLDLANAVGVSEQEVARWLCGTHDITLRSIAKLEVALGDEII